MFITCLQGLSCHRCPYRLAHITAFGAGEQWSVYGHLPNAGAGERLQREECWAVPEAEDTQSWLSFTGQLHGHSRETVGTLDLGGASTQITFLPQFEVSCLHEGLVSSPLGRYVTVPRKWWPIFRQQLCHRWVEWSLLMTGYTSPCPLTVHGPFDFSSLVRSAAQSVSFISDFLGEGQGWWW